VPFYVIGTVTVDCQKEGETDDKQSRGQLHSYLRLAELIPDILMSVHILFWIDILKESLGKCRNE
jgi:hypothetical protein